MCLHSLLSVFSLSSPFFSLLLSPLLLPSALSSSFSLRYPVDLRVKFLESFLRVFGESDEKDKQEVIDAKKAYQDAKEELQAQQEKKI